MLGPILIEFFLCVGGWPLAPRMDTSDINTVSPNALQDTLSERIVMLLSGRNLSATLSSS